jgi:hypothetical protein
VMRYVLFAVCMVISATDTVTPVTDKEKLDFLALVAEADRLGMLANEANTKAANARNKVDGDLAALKEIHHAQKCQLSRSLLWVDCKDK